ncbi:hypothetical protein [Rhizobium giardinii]|uniref:Uncharacterized protein n=1 Tax=Rhizobium giardinii TaxID=56731 RepID=A0A7W8UFK1_9HYPH|nr:hypothetical protein [Rhizobium giardinii]MBB5537642.1 hypothetical protein [Rhizobium giardinii]
MLSNAIPKPMTSEPAPANNAELEDVSRTSKHVPGGMQRLPTIMIGRKPMRAKLRVAIVAPHGQPKSSIVGAKPATSGERLRTVCTYIGKKVVNPMIDMLAKNTAKFANAIGRFNHRPGVTMGASAPSLLPDERGKSNDKDGQSHDC